MERHFDEELEVIRRKLVEMGGLAEQLIGRSIQILVSRDNTLSEEVWPAEQIVNQKQIEIDEGCLELLARHQPMATDLRFLVSTLRITGELERIADQAVNITEAALVLIVRPEVKPLIDIPRMATLASGMVKDSLDAFVRKDTRLARAVLTRDDQVDGYKNQIFRELLTYMLSDPKTIERAIELILISRHLERIADHATNVAEDAIYYVEGRDVRHHAGEAAAPSGESRPF
ncbi:MAG: phosphate signaling complex protein PhoU [candidate division Zixibacteria bacterium]|nr:phosphate signaling complex protein PhoU [candidate division Zixibacteria bacterium]